MSTTYEGWRRERQGVVFGLTATQAILCAALLTPTMVAMTVQAWMVAFYALLAGILACLFVALPISNRTLAQWTWQLTSFIAGRTAGWTAFRSKAATGLASPSDLAAADLPGVAASLRFHEGPPMPPLMTRVCVVQAPHQRRWFITGRVHHDGIATLDDATRSAYAAGLSGLLAALSQSEQVARLSLYTRSMPDDGAERALWVADHLDPNAPEVLHRSGAHVENVLRAASVRQEHFVTVGVDEDQVRGQARDLGGGVAGRGRVMHRILAEVEERLRGAGATSVEWLSGARLSDAIRTGYNPASAAGIEDARLRAARGQDILDGTLPGAAGPSLAPSPDVRRYHHDEYVTVSYALLLPTRATTVGRLAGLYLDLIQCEAFASGEPVKGFEDGSLQMCFTELRQLLDLFNTWDWSTYFSDYGKQESKYLRVNPQSALNLLDKVKEADKKKNLFTSLKKNERDKKKLIDTVVKQLKQLVITNNTS